MTWIRDARADADDPLAQLVEEAESHLRSCRPSPPTALWYSNWNDRVSEWVARHSDDDARQALVEIEVEDVGPRTTEQKLRLLRLLADA